MKTCKTCLYWGTVFGKFKTVSDCDKINDNYANKNLSFELTIQVHDLSNLNVRLMTGCDFGCIHHSGYNN